MPNGVYEDPTERDYPVSNGRDYLIKANKFYMRATLVNSIGLAIGILLIPLVPFLWVLIVIFASICGYAALRWRAAGFDHKYLESLPEEEAYPRRNGGNGQGGGSSLSQEPMELQFTGSARIAPGGRATSRRRAAQSASNAAENEKE